MADVLNETERERIRQETLLRAEVRREVDAALSQKLGWFGKLNSPFMITVMGGILITIAGQLFVRVSNIAERAQAKEQAVVEKKLAVLAAFSSDVDTAEVLEYNVRSKRLWLKEHPEPDAQDSLGQPRAEVAKQFDEFYRQYIEKKKMAAVLTDVAAFFDTPAVQRASEDFDKAWTAVETAPTVAAMEQKYGAVVKFTQALVRAMSEEIRQVGR